MQADTVPASCTSHTGEERRGADPKEGRELSIGKQPRIGAEILNPIDRGFPFLALLGNLLLSMHLHFLRKVYKFIDSSD